MWIPTRSVSKHLPRGATYLTWLLTLRLISSARSARPARRHGGLDLDVKGGAARHRQQSPGELESHRAAADLFQKEATYTAQLLLQGDNDGSLDENVDLHLGRVREAVAHLQQSASAIEPRAASLASSSALMQVEYPVGQITILQKPRQSEVPEWASSKEASTTDPSMGHWWPFHAFSPAPCAEDLSAVKAWAQELAVPDEPLEILFTNKTSNPADVLRKLAEKAQNQADGVDPDKQTLYHLLSTHFFKRSLEDAPVQKQFKKLSDDYQELQLLRADSSHEANRLKDSMLPDFFVGLAEHRRQQAESGKSGAPLQPLAMIFTCPFGGGHSSAARAVTDYLEADHWTVDTVDTTHDTRFIAQNWMERSRNLMDEYTWNDIIISKKWYEFYNLMDKGYRVLLGTLWSRCQAPFCDNERKKLFRAAILRRHPDLLITVYHMELMLVLELAKDLGNLPLIHIATDIDVKMSEVFYTQPIYSKFFVGLPFDNALAWESIAPLSKNQTFLSGYPLRVQFLEPPDKERIARERAARYPRGAFIVLIMSGGSGSDVPWPEILADAGLNESQLVHGIVVAGSNAKAESKLQKALEGSHQPLTINNHTLLQGKLPYVTLEVAKDPQAATAESPYFLSAAELALLMDIADLIITKAGGASTAEVAYRGIPAVFDATAGLLHWEALTVKAFEKQNRGVRLTEASPTELLKACNRALSFGRSSILARDLATNGVIDTRKRVQEMARKVMTVPCRGCPVFPSVETPSSDGAEQMQQ
mmetsp:Transcript_64219/g.114007  ORF Transcript_64219/g.114007 Transcript_64219/m.114007 type:complete len:762 (+) Transcript_64219:51-2336(+)